MNRDTRARMHAWHAWTTTTSCRAWPRTHSACMHMQGRFSRLLPVSHVPTCIRTPVPTQGRPVIDVNCKVCTLAGMCRTCSAAGAGDACLQSISRAVVTYSPHRLTVVVDSSYVLQLQASTRPGSELTAAKLAKRCCAGPSM